MFARIVQVQIVPGKLKEFLVAVDSLRPGLRKQSGFRTLVILRSAETPASKGDDGEVSATSITLWDTMEHMRASEKNMFLYQALARMKAYYKGFPQIREEEVIASEMGGGRPDDTQA